MKKLKKLKKVISITLATALLCLSAVPVMAEEDISIKEQVEQLEQYCIDIEYSYGLVMANREPGDTYLKYTDNSVETLNSYIAEARKVENKYPEVTSEELDLAKQTVDLGVQNLCIDKSELNFYVAFCKVENGMENDGYYSEEMWNSYSQLIDRAIELLLSDNASEEEINDAYWDLVFKFNEMCVSNDLVGDVNNDGIISVTDVTLLQKYLVGIISFNASQKMVAANQYGDLYNISVVNVMALQKAIVSIDTIENDYYFNLIKNNLYSKAPNHFENNPFYRIALLLQNRTNYNEYLVI